MEEYSRAHKEANNSAKRDKDIFLNEIADRAERAAAAGQQGILYQMSKTLAGKRRKADIPVKDKEGRAISEQEEKIKRWAEYFKELLNRPQPDNPPEILPARRDLPILCDPPTKEEIRRSVRQLNSGKAAGPDQIPPEALKANVEMAVDELEGLFYKIWMKEKYPYDWKEGHIVKLLKKGDLSLYGFNIIIVTVLCIVLNYK